MDENIKPVGGKWSFDAENRKKIPAGTISQIIQNFKNLNITMRLLS